MTENEATAVAKELLPEDVLRQRVPEGAMNRIYGVIAVAIYAKENSLPHPEYYRWPDPGERWLEERYSRVDANAL